MLWASVSVMLLVREKSRQNIPSRDDIVLGRGRRRKGLSGVAIGGGTVFLTGTFRLSRIDLGASLWALIALIVVDLVVVEAPSRENSEN